MLIVAALGVVLRCCVADLGRVSGGSMRPALCDGDHILTNRLAYGLRLPCTDAWPLRWSAPRRGEIVVLLSPVDGKRLVKRITGVPGDRLDDGTTIAEGYYFVQGDDRENSIDSRAFGCVWRERIVGRLVWVLPGGR